MHDALLVQSQQSLEQLIAQPRQGTGILVPRKTRGGDWRIVKIQKNTSEFSNSAETTDNLIEKDVFKLFYIVSFTT